MTIENDVSILSQVLYSRFLDLALAPLQNQNMLWAAVPLAIATLFITLYFGRNRREELGWNTAFGNTMVFLFVAISLIKEMYGQGGSWGGIFSNELYLALSIALASASLMLMFITYFHLMPKRAAFFLFSAPPINVTVYVVMTIVYANVPPDLATVAAGILLLITIILLTKIIQLLIRLIGLDDKGKDERADDSGMEKLAKMVEEEIRGNGTGGLRPLPGRAPRPSRRTV
jgi:hypothetical protein